MIDHVDEDIFILARKFHELTQAYELLLDPLRRLALDAKIRIKEARKERFSAYDAKRKGLVDELEERERAFKKSRVDKQKEEVERWRETEKIKEEGKRLREEREKEIQNMESEQLLGSLDTTIRLKYTLTDHPTLTTPVSISDLLAPFGSIDTQSIVLSLKPPKKTPHKPPKYATALVPFKQIGDAFAAVCASGRPERGLNGIVVGWAEGKEPQILAWLKKMGKLGTQTPPEDGARLPQVQTGSNSSPFSSFPESFPEFPKPSAKDSKTTPIGGIDYESLTLMRLRQAERERLERDILQEEND